MWKHLSLIEAFPCRVFFCQLMLLKMLFVIQGSLTITFFPTFKVFSGACLSMLLSNFWWNTLKLLFVSSSDRDCSQFSLAISLLIFFSARSSNFQCFTVFRPFIDLFWFSKFTKRGMWSLMSSTSI